MSRITLELNSHDVKQLVEKLSIQDKIKLVRQLEKETLRQRWDNLLNTIDSRFKKYPLSEEEIGKEIERARKEHYAKRRH